MTDDGALSAQPVMELDALLLDAKLTAPQPRPGTVSRAGLIESARSSGSPVVGVTAPAGYGKSTLLAEWAQVEDRPVAWVSLDEFDDDPAILLTLLASAYTRVAPGHDDLVADVGGVGVSILGRVAPRLASAFRTSPDPFVLMLDDLHEVRSPACHDALSVVISGVPRGSQLVAASRFEQPHLPRLRVSGEAVELLAGDLALDAAGAEQIFANADITLTPELAAAVSVRTEGWAAGLYLASLIAKDSDGAVLSVAGDDRYVADYLYRESLARVPETTRRFLRCTAVLEQLSAPLCDAVVGSSDAHDELRRLEASSTFLIPLDRRRGWFRYHALFREFLLSELDRVEPEVVAKLHLRAADWYESNGSPAKALDHLLQTAERDRCVQLLTALILPTYQAGQMSTVQRWLTVIGDAAVADYPPLAVLAAWTAVLSGEATEAERWASIVDAASFDLIATDGAASFDSARAMVRSFMCPAGPEQALADASLAVEQEPVWSVWRDTAIGTLGLALLLTGEQDVAHDLFVEASARAEVTGNADTRAIVEGELAVLAMDAGEWATARDHVERALATIDEHRMHDYPTSLLAFACAARLAVHRGDLDEAERQLTRAMRARPASTLAMPYLAVRARLQLAKIYWSIGEYSTARHLQHEIDDILRARPALGVLAEQVAEFRQILNAQSGVAGGIPLTPAELRLLPYLQTHLTFGDIGKRLFVSRNTISSQVSSIYRKLGVSSRAEAVQKATSVGLIGA